MESVLHTPAIPSASKKEFREAKRVQASVLSGVEKRALIWMAQRLPAWVNSDHLTVLGFVSMIGAGFAYAMASFYPAALLAVNVLLAVNWFGDSLDGTLARVRNRLRPRYGYYVDHLIDAVSAVFLFVGLGFSGYMSERVAMGMLLCYLLLAIQSYLAAHSLGVFSISWWKFSPTEMRILLAIGNTVAFYHPISKVFGPQLLFFDVAGGISILCMVTTMVWIAVRNTVALYNEERL